MADKRGAEALLLMVGGVKVMEYITEANVGTRAIQVTAKDCEFPKLVRDMERIHELLKLTYDAMNTAMKQFAEHLDATGVVAPSSTEEAIRLLQEPTNNLMSAAEFKRAMGN